jgi:hypothetical protein
MVEEFLGLESSGLDHFRRRGKLDARDERVSRVPGGISDHATGDFGTGVSVVRDSDALESSRRGRRRECEGSFTRARRNAESDVVIMSCP